MHHAHTEPAQESPIGDLLAAIGNPILILVIALALSVAIYPLLRRFDPREKERAAELSRAKRRLQEVADRAENRRHEYSKDGARSMGRSRALRLISAEEWAAVAGKWFDIQKLIDRKVEEDRLVHARAPTIVSEALAKGELDKLLLRDPRYYCDYDPIELVIDWYSGIDNDGLAKATEPLTAGLRALGGTYEGIYPIAMVVGSEIFMKHIGRPTAGLPLDELTSKLRETICEFTPRLRADGRLEVLRHESRITVDNGGQPFCDP